MLVMASVMVADFLMQGTSAVAKAWVGDTLLFLASLSIRSPSDDCIVILSKAKDILMNIKKDEFFTLTYMLICTPMFAIKYVL